MGIYQFVGSWIKRSHYRKSFFNIKQLPNNIDSLCIDCNGIFHNAAQKIYLYGKYNNDNRDIILAKKTKDELVSNHVKEIINQIDYIYEKFKPAVNFILTPDGIANFGKMNQQRQRRYKNAGKSFFDSNSITPGTELMNTIDKHIKEWIKTKTFKTKSIIYSSHLMTGEGEHKIYEMIRNYKLKRTKNSHLIYGLDSDLILLSCLSPLHNIYLIREDSGEVMNINTFKYMIYNDLNWGKCEKKRIMQDFSILCMFIGNDFLPKFPGSIDVNHTMKQTFSIYRKIKLYLTDESNTIIWKNMCLFFEEYVKREKLSYEQNFNNPKSIPYPEYKLSSKNGNFDLTKFSKLWYKKYGNSKQTMIKEYLKTLQWVQYYYNYGFDKVSNTHYYKYFYTPLPHDILEYLKNEDNHKELSKFSKNCNINFVHQHLIVLPPSSLDLINKKYHIFYNDLNNPVNFKKKLEGVHCFKCKCACTCLDYMSIAYIPAIQKTKIMKLKCPQIKENIIELQN